MCQMLFRQFVFNLFFFFQAEDGIRDYKVTGVQTCALPISMDMSRLVNTLSNFMDRPVIDNTDLKGVYDVELSFMPDESLSLKGHGGPMMMPSGGPGDARMGPPQDSNAPGGNIFQALQSFGLKLEARKDPVENLVIDHANRVPTEN